MLRILNTTLNFGKIPYVKYSPVIRKKEPEKCGYYGAEYDRYTERLDDSAIGKVKQQFWTAKQTIISKFGKREDPSLVASDAELDAKLQVYHSVKQTCENLLKCIEHYQDYICELSQEENALGRFLKGRGKADKTQAGKIMAAVGRAQGYTAQQRLSLRVPLVRLYQELEVFTERAVADCQHTVEAMEEARTKYRGSLLWMKDVSDKLNPDMYSQLEKFRSVQAQVRRNKSKFDKLKLDCLQKIDLLSASRCNLFSNILANYQTCLMTFWDKTTKAHTVISESFKGYQYYEFTILKDLTEPSRKLLDSTSTVDENDKPKDEQKSTESPELISLDVEKEAADSLVRSDSLENLFKDSPETERSTRDFNVVDEFASLLALGDSSSKRLKQKTDGTKENETAGTQPVSDKNDLLEFLDEIDRNSNETSFAQQWDQAFGGGVESSLSQTKTPPSSVMSSMNEIGNLQTASATASNSNAKNLLPSELLDLQLSNFAFPQLQQQQPFIPPKNFLSNNSAFNATSNVFQTAKSSPATAGVMPKKSTLKDMDKSAWFNLFADVDPLQNPDALGKPAGSGSDNGC